MQCMSLKTVWGVLEGRKEREGGGAVTLVNFLSMFSSRYSNGGNRVGI